MKNKNKKFLIILDRLELYKDFTFNLLYYIDHYYLDYESLYKDSDINNHFYWCYNKACDEFLEEGIDFKNNDELKEYFRGYYFNYYYKAQADTTKDLSLKYFEKIWTSIFDFEQQKNKNVTNILIELYTIFDKSLTKEKNVLEYI